MGIYSCNLQKTNIKLNKDVVVFTCDLENNDFSNTTIDARNIMNPDEEIYCCNLKNTGLNIIYKFVLDENSNTRKDIITIHLNKSNTNLLNSNTQKSLIIEEVTLTKENENNSVSQNNNVVNNKFIENFLIIF